jgi:hypothetical protein
MSLYLCIFEGDEDIDGIDVGSYEDFNAFREHVVVTLEGDEIGSRYPTFALHSDSEGEWSVADCAKLVTELSSIAASMKLQPALPFPSDWQKALAKSIGLAPTNAFESFIEVDGEFFLDRLRALAALAVERGLPILFQ